MTQTAQSSAPEEVEFSGAELVNESVEDLDIKDYWSWAESAACNRKHELYGPRDKAALAKYLCNSLCPVAKDCLIWSLMYKEDGLWGGMTRGERDKAFTDSFVGELREKAKSQRMLYDPQRSLAAFVQQFPAPQVAQ